MSKNDGGTAFPSHGSMGEVAQEGMSRHDYFTAKIMQGFCANPAIFAHDCCVGWSLVNCTDAQLIGYARGLASCMIEASELSAHNHIGE